MNEHSGHCRACKERVRELLEAIYGECRANVSFSWPALPQAYGQSAVRESLELIRAALGDFRGYRDFIKSAQVPPCDFYVSDPPVIIEFDESQHFTAPRLLSLSLYPEDFNQGFPLTRWQELCRRIGARDDTPIDRDERRAWYDTLRDLIPSHYGFQPTVSIYAEDTAWCSLDPSCARHLEFFCRAAQGRTLPR